MEFDDINSAIIEEAISIHKDLGPGLLESVYEFALMKELTLRKIPVGHQVQLPLPYKGSDTGKSFFIDLLIDKEIIVEIKAVESLLPVHDAQLLSYLMLTNKRLGFLINFNVVLLKHGFRRKVNDY